MSIDPPRSNRLHVGSVVRCAYSQHLVFPWVITGGVDWLGIVLERVLVIEAVERGKVLLG